MSDKGIERRLCQRFVIPGATVSYRLERLFLKRTEFAEEFCPMVDISRGGVRFMTQKPLKFKKPIFLQIALPGERIPLNLKGQVRWSSFNAGKSFKYQGGIQFHPYGEAKNQNYPGILVKIIALEQKFIDPNDPDNFRKKSEFSI